MKSSIEVLSLQLDKLRLLDKQRLLCRLHEARKVKNLNTQLMILNELESNIVAAQKKMHTCIISCPEITYPEHLPITQKKQDILNAIKKNQVVIVAGETGSGKTTQLPKICLELGRGIKGIIGHTQPRRIAARSVAQRIADELKTPLGDSIGYKVRFTDQVNDYTLVQLMTDGILLSEIKKDPLLIKYDTLIIDEAHERSLNIDFILGYLKTLLPKRLDLKIIITSATLDPKKFSCYFNSAPIIEVSGRTYPVLVRYRPIVTNTNDSECDLLQGICNAVNELQNEEPGDILIFMNGEREIYETARALNLLTLPHTEILPLYARLSNSEQNLVFQPHHGRRIVLATNIAETSLTVPGIKYVIDPGSVRINRYNSKTKVQRLQVELISQASANQRTGRCGRISEGICIRLYSEQDFLSRPNFTDPEILRTNLASVILQITSLNLGNITDFPFLEAPKKRNIKNGIQLLEELGAIKKNSDNGYCQLTTQGFQLAKLPIDPRFARMVLEAIKNGSVHEIIIITAALSIQDPRERSIKNQKESNEKHCLFDHKDSDFLTFVNLWNYLQKQQKMHSFRQFRQLCHDNCLNYLRVLEWKDIYTQLYQIVKKLGFPINSVPSNYRSIHSAILTGSLSHIGKKDTDNQIFVSTRNTKFSLFYDSQLFKKSLKWIMVAELIETNRIWGRIGARIKPEWIESLAQHLVKYSYSELHWSKEKNTVIGSETLTLFSLTIIYSRLVDYSKIDPRLCRELFIRHALVEGDWETQYTFFHKNFTLRAEVEELEHKLRRRDILVDDETLFRFYEERIPNNIVSGKHFDQWWQDAKNQQPDLLNIKKEMLIKNSANAITMEDYPNFWNQGNFKLHLTYQFEPGAHTDGVTVHIPLSILNEIKGQSFEWQIPVIRRELVIALIKSLPKPIRRNFVPPLHYAEAFLSRVTAFSLPLLHALEIELHRISGVTVSRTDWRWDQVPDHLKITFRIVDEKNKKLCEGKDLEALQIKLNGEIQKKSFKDTNQGLEQDNLHIWNFGQLPTFYEQQRCGYSITVYPALVDKKDSVAIRLFDSEQDQKRAMWDGTRRLLLLNIPLLIKSLYEKYTNKVKLNLSFNPYSSGITLIEDCITCGIDKIIYRNSGPVWQEEEFTKLHQKVCLEFNQTILEIINQVEQILKVAFKLHKQLKGNIDLSMALAFSDIKSQLGKLIYRGFISAHGWKQLPYTLRYLQAIEHRIKQCFFDPNRDRAQMFRVLTVQKIWEEWMNKLSPSRQQDDEIRSLYWMIEELRVSLFAQHLSTSYSLSDKQILKTIKEFSSKENNIYKI